MVHKSDLRRSFLAKRQQIDRVTYQAMSEQISTQLAQTDLFQASRLICAYASFRQEPDLSTLFLAYPQKQWLFPRCVIPQNITAANTPPEFSLTWHEIPPSRWSELMVQGHYGIWEPHPDLPAVKLNADLRTIDLILVPAVAVDRLGYRLGYGAGFYDRWLQSQTAPTLGVVFSEFVCDQLPHDVWDVPLHYLLTEQGIWQCP